MLTPSAARRPNTQPSAFQIGSWQTRFEINGGQFLNIVGSFKSFPVQADDHYYAVVRYVERNAFRPNLVARAEQWRWSSLWQRQHPGEKMAGVLHPWPLPEPGDWLKRVNAAQSSAEFEALRRAVVRGSPFGSTSWQVRTARRLGLEFTLRPRGRPTKQKA